MLKMMADSHRRTLTFLMLTSILVASMTYDTVLLQIDERWQRALAGVMAVSFAIILLLQRYSVPALSQAFMAVWPLHLYSLAFLGVIVGFHGGSRLMDVLAYTYFAYASYLFVPMILRLDRTLLRMFVESVAVASALMAVPSFFGAVGFQSLGGIPLRVKPTYAEFSGIIASGGFFEHAEGHALQMGFGILCSVYLLQYAGGVLGLLCLVLTTAGLIVSQGRAAIYGLGIAAVYHFLPAVFRHSRPIFFGTLIVLLTFPFLIWPQLGKLPGISSYLRIERGLSGRGEAWDYAIYAIGQRPRTGYGFMASAVLTESEQRTLRRAGFSGTGTTFHNTFISKAVDLGVFVAFLYCLLYFVPLCRVCAKSPNRLELALIRSVLLLVLTASIYRDYNIGGVRSTVIIGAIFLGLACVWRVEDKPPLLEMAPSRG
jgi:O-antigen ligase